MDPVTAGALLAGGASLLGTGISSAFNLFGAKQNRDFQERMSNTAHQREVRDLERAGLNPMLSARLGGSSTPPGSSAQAGQSSLGHDVSQGAQIAAQLAVAKAQANDLNSAAALKDTQKGDITYGQQERVQLMLAQARQALAAGDLSEHNVRRVQQEIKNMEEQLRLLRVETSHSAFDLDRMRRESEFYRSPAGKAAPYMKFSPFTGNVPSLIRR